MFQPEKDFEEYGRFVFKYLMSLCGDGDLAEELTQETFYRAIRSSGRFDGSCKVSTWLCQIAKHVWYQELDKRRRRKEEPLQENGGEGWFGKRVLQEGTDHGSDESGTYFGGECQRGFPPAHHRWILL